MKAASATSSVQGPAASGLRWWAIALAVALGAVMLTAALTVPVPALGSLFDALAEPRRLLAKLAGVAICYGGWLIAGLMLGMTLAAAFRSRRRSSASAAGLLCAAALGAAVAGPLASIAWGPTRWLAGPALAAAVGVVVGGLWQRGRGGKAGAAALLGLLIVGPTVVAWGVFNEAVADDPHIKHTESVPAGEKRQLVERLRAARERGEATGRVALELSERDVNLLAAWVLELGQMPQAAMQVALQPGGSANLAATLRAGWRHWVNLETTFDLQVNSPDLRIDVQHMRIGRWTVPQRLTQAMAGWIAGDPALRELLEAVERFETGRRTVRLAYAPDRLPEDLVARLTGRDEPSDVQRLAELYAAELAHAARRADRKTMTDPLPMLLRAVFGLADERTAGGGDPRRENHAAIYALAVYCGHAAVQELYGDIFDGGMPANRPAWLMRRLRMRGRHDLARHFWISAIVALVADPHVSSFVGELKEQIDSADGGSGFSFVDLLADRAGTRFGEFATSTPGRARYVQQRLRHAASTDLLMPPHAGLPEGLDEAAFKKQYGGVDTREYRRMVDLIDRRIDQLHLYRTH